MAEQCDITRPTAPMSPAKAPGHEAGPKRILSIDSSGLHSFVSLAMLGRIETVLRAQSAKVPVNQLVGTQGRPFRLSRYFDLIGGSGTGALIAAGLAWGHSAEDLIDMMKLLARASLRKRWLGGGSSAGVDRAALLSALHDLFGCAPLTTSKLRTGLAVVARRVDGPRSTVILSNRAPLPGVRPSMRGDAGVTVADAVRASLPTLSGDQAEIVPCGAGLHGAFKAVDHGPHGDPAMALLLLATNAAGAGRADHEPGLGWRADADNLFMASVGAVRGRRYGRMAPQDQARMRFGGAEAVDAALMGEAMMRSMAVSSKRSLSVDDVTGGFAPEALRSEPKLTYARYAMTLDQAWLQDRVERRLSHREIDRLRMMSRDSQIEPLLTLARDIADAEVRPDHFPARFATA